MWKRGSKTFLSPRPPPLKIRHQRTKLTIFGVVGTEPTRAYAAAFGTVIEIKKMLWEDFAPASEALRSIELWAPILFVAICADLSGIIDS